MPLVTVYIPTRNRLELLLRAIQSCLAQSFADFEIIVVDDASDQSIRGQIAAIAEASMQLMLALDTLGLASCPINWPDVERLERKMDKFLQLQPWQRPVMLIAVGYPDPTGGIPFSAKKSVVQTLVPFSSAQNENNNAD